jgi:NADH-quinone oxidoreductase subunit N
MAGLVAVIKLLLLTQGATGTTSGWNLPPSAFVFLWVISAATMTIGNVLGLMQNNFKRMLAYSSIAHSGYMLIGVLVGPSSAGGPLPDGVSAALFYMAVYGVMNLGAFAVLSLLEARGQAVEELEDLAGLAKRQPAFALALAICLFSLMGMPPTGGFFGKIYIFGSALSASGQSHGAALVWLAIIGLLNSAVAAAYYLRAIATLYLRDEQTPTTIAPYSGGVRIGVVLCTLFVIVVGVYPQALIKLAKQSTIGLRPTATVVRGDAEESHRSG